MSSIPPNDPRLTGPGIPHEKSAAEREAEARTRRLEAARVEAERQEELRAREDDDTVEHQNAYGGWANREEAAGGSDSTPAQGRYSDPSPYDAGQAGGGDGVGDSHSRWDDGAPSNPYFDRAPDRDVDNGMPPYAGPPHRPRNSKPMGFWRKAGVVVLSIPVVAVAWGVLHHYFGDDVGNTIQRGPRSGDIDFQNSPAPAQPRFQKNRRVLRFENRIVPCFTKRSLEF